jgi:hypothetical protein
MTRIENSGDLLFVDVKDWVRRKRRALARGAESAHPATIFRYSVFTAEIFREIARNT